MISKLQFFCLNRIILSYLCLIALLARHAIAIVYIFTPDNTTLQFPDAEAAFGGVVPTQGMVGYLQRSEPLDACQPLSNFLRPKEVSFVIIERGNCVFDLKVWHAQQAGFQAAIVYNNEDGRELVTMSSQYLQEVAIPAIFVTKRSGETLLEASDSPDNDCLITPTFDSSAWSLVTLTVLFILALSAVLGTFYVFRRHRLRRVGSRLVLVPTQAEPEGMPEREVQALRTTVFNPNKKEGENGTMETCAICLEDYTEGEKLRVLPCCHEFHVACIDQWLTTRRPFCPVCKRDPRDPVGSQADESQTELTEGLLEESTPNTNSQSSTPWFSALIPQLLAFGNRGGGQPASLASTTPVPQRVEG